MLHKTHFTIDGIEAIFEGYTDGSHWNGWACPWFTKEIADDIMRVTNKGNENVMRYNQEIDTYSYFIDEGNNSEFKGQYINGKHLYPIGNGYWIWDDLADYQSATSKEVLKCLCENYKLTSEKLYEAYYDIVAEIDDHELTGLYSDNYELADLCEVRQTVDEYAETNGLTYCGNHGIYMQILRIEEVNK